MSQKHACSSFCPDLCTARAASFTLAAASADAEGASAPVRARMTRATAGGSAARWALTMWEDIWGAGGAGAVVGRAACGRQDRAASRLLVIHVGPRVSPCATPPSAPPPRPRDPVRHTSPRACVGRVEHSRARPLSLPRHLSPAPPFHSPSRSSYSRSTSWYLDMAWEGERERGWGAVGEHGADSARARIALALIPPSHLLGLDLARGVGRDTDQNQQTRARKPAKGGQPRRALDERRRGGERAQERRPQDRHPVERARDVVRGGAAGADGGTGGALGRGGRDFWGVPRGCRAAALCPPRSPHLAFELVRQVDRVELEEGVVVVEEDDERDRDLDRGGRGAGGSPRGVARLVLCGRWAPRRGRRAAVAPPAGNSPAVTALGVRPAPRAPRCVGAPATLSAQPAGWGRGRFPLPPSLLLSLSPAGTVPRWARRRRRRAPATARTARGRRAGRAGSTQR